MFHSLSLSDKLLNTLRGPVQKHLANLHPGENTNTRNHSGLHIKALFVAGGPPPHDEEQPIYELSPGYNFSVSCNCLTLVTEVFTCICVVSLTRWKLLPPSYLPAQRSAYGGHLKRCAGVGNDRKTILYQQMKASGIIPVVLSPCVNQQQPGSLLKMEVL